MTHDATPASRDRGFWPCLGLIGAGLVVSATLLARLFSLIADPDAGVDLCSLIFSISCDVALADTGWWVLGLPLAGWGAVYYATLASLLLFGWTMGEAFEAEARRGALLAVEIGAWASVALASIMIAGRAPFCPLCLLALAINVALVPVVRSLCGNPIAPVRSTIRALKRHLADRQSEPARDARWKFVGFVTVALVALVAYQWTFVQVQLRLAVATQPSAVLAAFAAQPEQEVPVDPEDPRLGPLEAPNELVVFTSFQCPGCQSLARELHDLVERHPDELAIVFKHFPLGKDCNPAVVDDLHPRSCEAARAAEAARGQGRFWPFHDRLFDTDLEVAEKTLLRIAREVELDLARFDADRRAESAAERVASDVALGEHLGVDGTPAVFLNGRRVRDLSRQALEVLIRQ